MHISLKVYKNVLHTFKENVKIYISQLVENI